MTIDNDLPFVQALQKGDESAFKELMVRHKAGLFRFIFRYVNNEATAVDLTQETFVRAYFNIQSFKPKARFITWLYSIATNLCRDYVGSRAYRNASRTVSLNSDRNNQPVEFSIATSPPPDEMAQHTEEIQTIQAAIHQLPSDLKTALILTALEGVTHIEAAKRLGTTPKTVETRVYRARKQLAKILNNALTEIHRISSDSIRMGSSRLLSKRSLQQHEKSPAE